MFILNKHLPLSCCHQSCCFHAVCLFSANSVLLSCRISPDIVCGTAVSVRRQWVLVRAAVCANRGEDSGGAVFENSWRRCFRNSGDAVSETGAPLFRKQRRRSFSKIVAASVFETVAKLFRKQDDHLAHFAIVCVCVKILRQNVSESVHQNLNF